MLKGKVALVTGASRGIGRGIALQLGTAGAIVYVTGRQPSQSGAKSDMPTLDKTAEEITKRGGTGIAVYCDHANAKDIESLFERIKREQNGKLDILVNNAYSAVNLLMNTAGKKFWELDPLVWDEINNVGLRNHYICSVYAARMMIPAKSGLIVNVSSSGGLRYLFNVAYGVGKEACDRMAVDCAIELKQHNVACISLWPGAAKTETVESVMKTPETSEVVHEYPLYSDKIMTVRMKDIFEDGETVEYSGKCIVHLAADPNIMKKTGRVLVTGDLGDYYGFIDVDGRKPKSIRSVKTLLEFANYKGVAGWVPDWVKLPGWLLSLGGNKL